MKWPKTRNAAAKRKGRPPGRKSAPRNISMSGRACQREARNARAGRNGFPCRGCQPAFHREAFLEFGSPGHPAPAFNGVLASRWLDGRPFIAADEILPTRQSDALHVWSYPTRPQSWPTPCPPQKRMCNGKICRSTVCRRPPQHPWGLAKTLIIYGESPCCVEGPQGGGSDCPGKGNPCANRMAFADGTQVALRRSIRKERFGGAR